MSEKHFLCVRRSVPAQQGESREKPSPAQMEEMYAKFTAWQEKFKGNIVDMGGRLGDGKTVDAEGTKDGPFAEAKEIIAGFMVLSAASVDEAIAIACELPGMIGSDGSLEVREIHTS
jgi:hypothetical protein